MCTLILAHRVFDDSPVFLATNRDEQLQRPASGPSVWEYYGMRILAPKDEQEGGTWLGVNEWGITAAITNRAGAVRDGSRQSRGYLVLEALKDRYARVAADGIAALRAEEYNPFHLLVADRDYAEIVWSDGSAIQREELDPGVTVVTERSFGAAPNQRAVRLRERIEALEARDELHPDALAALLREHQVDDIDAVSVLVREWDYGTRSSTILSAGGQARSFRHADGAPNDTDYRDYSHLLEKVLR